MTNPVIAEVLRGELVESQHTGAYCVVNLAGEVVKSSGDIARPIYPRSAIKAFQCYPMIEQGAADYFKLTDEEIALACASHSGEPEHVRVAAGMLAKIGEKEDHYECGVHWPLNNKAQHQLVREGQEARQIHNNCSGKHAGMLALAHHLATPVQGYTTPDHPVQQAIAQTIAKLCAVDVASLDRAIDGCSVPTWAFPLRNIALGFAKLTEPTCQPGQRIIKAVRAHPFLVAGSGRFDTKLMQAVPRAFVKVGAEGVYAGCIPHAHLGFALKCDDGSRTAAEVAIAALLASLPVWDEEERHALASLATEPMKNWRKMPVGETHATGFNQQA